MATARHHLFIDTNVYLSLFQFATGDLEEIRKLAAVVTNRRVNLIVTDQVVREFGRNRESKIREALTGFTESKISIPNICRWHELSAELLETVDKFNKIKKELLREIEDEVETNLTRADSVISDLFKSIEPIECDESILKAARIRTFRGDPPGKNNSHGDAINWECLLSVVPDGEDLHFIGGDGDYEGKSKGKKFSLYLRDEWEKRKNSEVHYYPELTGYFAKHYPKIKLANQLDKQLAIEGLANSSSFASTKQALRRLARIKNFTVAEICDILKAATENNQVYQIARDHDVMGPINQFVSGSENKLPRELYLQWRHFFNRPIHPKGAMYDTQFASNYEYVVGNLMDNGFTHEQIELHFDPAFVDCLFDEAEEQILADLRERYPLADIADDSPDF